MEVKVSDLRAVSEKLFTHLEEIGCQTISLPADYYWHVPIEELYVNETAQNPENLSIGQLTDDWQELQKMIGNANEDPIAYNLVHLAAVLRAIGEQIIG